MYTAFTLDLFVDNVVETHIKTDNMLKLIPVQEIVQSGENDD